jgi:hypothetical protein
MMMMMMMKLVEWMVLAVGTELLGENLPRRHFVHKSHFPDPGANPGRRGGKPATNRFSYGAAHYLQLRPLLFSILELIPFMVSYSNPGRVGGILTRLRAGRQRNLVSIPVDVRQISLPHIAHTLVRLLSDAICSGLKMEVMNLIIISIRGRG